MQHNRKKKNKKNLQICNHQAPPDKMRLQDRVWTNEICLNAITGSWIFAAMMEKTVKQSLVADDAGKDLGSNPSSQEGSDMNSSHFRWYKLTFNWEERKKMSAGSIVWLCCLSEARRAVKGLNRSPSLSVTHGPLHPLKLHGCTLPDRRPCLHTLSLFAEPR